MPRIVDLSMPIVDRGPVFPAYPSPVVHKWLSIGEDGFYANLLIMVEHTATHVDAPAHVLRGGATVDRLDLDRFMGRAFVVDVSDLPPRSTIGPERVEEEARRLGLQSLEGVIVLFHTGYSRYAGSPRWFDHPGLGAEAARWLVERGVKAVGTDAPSIDREPYDAHRVLLEAGVPVYENLANLDRVVGRVFTFIGFPLAIAGGSGSPVRAVAVLED